MRHPGSAKRGGRVVTDVEAGGDGRWGCDWRAQSKRTAKSCGPDPPTLGSSLQGLRPGRRRWLESPARRGEHVYAV